MELFFAQFGQKPLASFIPGLIRLKRAQKELRKSLGSDSEEIIRKALGNEELSADDLANCDDVLADLVSNESESVNTIIGLGGYDKFEINVMKFGDVYWISAAEFDDIGYFGSEKDAEVVAESNYEPFISAATESEEHREDEK